MNSRDRFWPGAENVLRPRPQNEEALKGEQIQRLRQKVGDLAPDLDIRKTSAEVRPRESGTLEP